MAVQLQQNTFKVGLALERKRVLDRHLADAPAGGVEMWRVDAWNAELIANFNERRDLCNSIVVALEKLTGEGVGAGEGVLLDGVIFAEMTGESAQHALAAMELVADFVTLLADTESRLHDEHWPLLRWPMLLLSSLGFRVHTHVFAEHVRQRIRIIPAQLVIILITFVGVVWLRSVTLGGAAPAVFVPLAAVLALCAVWVALGSAVSEYGKEELPARKNKVKELQESAAAATAAAVGPGPIPAFGQLTRFNQLAHNIPALRDRAVQQATKAMRPVIAKTAAWTARTTT